MMGVTQCVALMVIAIHLTSAKDAELAASKEHDIKKRDFGGFLAATSDSWSDDDDPWSDDGYYDDDYYDYYEDDDYKRKKRDTADVKLRDIVEKAIKLRNKRQLYGGYLAASDTWNDDDDDMWSDDDDDYYDYYYDGDYDYDYRRKRESKTKGDAMRTLKTVVKRALGDSKRQLYGGYLASSDAWSDDDDDYYYDDDDDYYYDEDDYDYKLKRDKAAGSKDAKAAVKKRAKASILSKTPSKKSTDSR